MRGMQAAGLWSIGPLLCLGACASMGAAPTVSPASYPPDEAAITIGALSILPSLKFPGPPEISQVRPAAINAPAEWRVCVRDPASWPYALFFNGHQLVGNRRAAIIDECHREIYTPLNTPPPPQ